jgi:hypothetical protein
MYFGEAYLPIFRRVNLYFLFLFFAASILHAQITPGYYLVKSDFTTDSKDKISYRWIATNNTSANGDFYIVENLPALEEVQSISGASPTNDPETKPDLPLIGASPLTIGPFPISADTSVTLLVSGLSHGPSRGSETFAIFSEAQLAAIKNQDSLAVTLGLGTPTLDGRPLPVVRAVPNISYDNEPIDFQVSLNSSALLKLTLFSITGERVFNSEEQASAGNSRLIWNIQNNGGQTVASGLYIYLLN